jgi:hypothetical protein
MTIETFLGIACFVLVVISQLVIRWCEKNTYLKYKEQKVGGKQR